MEKKFKKGMKVKTWLCSGIGTVVSVNKYTRTASVRYTGMKALIEVSLDDPNVTIYG